MTETLTLYRVETQDGNGPYKVGRARYQEIHGTEAPWQYDCSRHPTPDEDGIGQPDTDQYCAFLSLEQFRAWFNARECALLAAQGYVLAIYHAATPFVRRGRCQCLFCRTRAQRVDVIALA